MITTRLLKSSVRSFMLPLIAAGLGVAGSIAGSIIDGDERKSANESNQALQREFAQNGIRWKVADAKAAGVHPLYALGAQTHMASPSFVGSDVGRDVARMGQDISRAVSATQSEEERTLSRLTLERAGLENELLRSRIARENSAQVGPGVPIGHVIPQPLKPTFTDSNPGVTVGEVPDVTYGRTAGGTLVPLPSSNTKELIEDNIFQEAMHFFRNNILPPTLYPPLDQTKGEDVTWIPGFGWVPGRKFKYSGR